MNFTGKPMFPSPCGGELILPVPYIPKAKTQSFPSPCGVELIHYIPTEDLWAFGFRPLAGVS